MRAYEATFPMLRKHNAKFGVQFSHTFLTEGFQFGITDLGLTIRPAPILFPDCCRLI